MSYEQLPSPGGPRAGYTERGQPGVPTSQDWINAFVMWASQKWATATPEERKTFLGGTMNTGLYGPMDPTDTMVFNPQTGIEEPLINPATSLLTLTRLAQAYQGNDPEIESGLGPWIPPREGDFKETAATTAARIATEQWERNYERQVTADERIAKRSEFANEIAREGIASSERISKADIEARLQAAGIAAGANIFNTQTQGATDIYGTQGSMYNAGLGFGADIYGTQAGMYNAQLGNQADIFGQLTQYQATVEALKAQGLDDATSNAIALQALVDQRVQNLISLKADPGNFVQAEFATRALGSPQGTEQPLYEDNQWIKDLINRQANIQPGAAPPTPSWYGQAPSPPVAPTAPVPPSAPTLPAAPNLNVGAQGTGGSSGGPPPFPINTSGGNQTLSQTPPQLKEKIITDPNDPLAKEILAALQPPPAASTNSTAFIPPPQSRAVPSTQKQSISQLLQGSNSSAFGNQSAAQTATPEMENAGNEYLNQVMNAGNFSAFAGGGMTQEPQFMTGDAQISGQPNPEVIDNPTGAPIGVMNEQNIMARIQELNQRLQMTQDPTEQQLLTEMLQHYQDMLMEIQGGKMGRQQMPPQMGQMPMGGGMPGYAWGTDFSSSG